MRETIRLIIEEHKSFSGQILKLAKSDLVRKYRGAALGWVWAIVKPSMTLFVFWFAFTVGLRSGKPVNGFPYFLWLLAGFLPWFYMRDMIQGGAECIRKYKHLVTKIKFPVSIIPTFTGLSHLAVHLLLCVISFLLFIAFGFMPDIYWLQIPLYMFMMWLFFTVWGLFAGVMSAMSKDFLNLVKSMIQALFWLSGVIFNVRDIPIDAVQYILYFNPITFFVTAFRDAIYDKAWVWDDPVSCICFAAVFVVTAVLSLVVYKRTHKEVADVL